MKNWYFTFGQGTPLRDNFVKITGESLNAAREAMIMKRGLTWAMQYSEEEFLQLMAKYDLKEIPL